MNTVTPDRILQTLAAHLASKYLLVAVEVGVFEQLVAGPLALDDLAGRMGLPRRTARMLVDALVAAEWLTVDGGRYSNTPISGAFLSGAQGGPDLRPILRMWNQVVYPQWATLEQSLRDDKATYGYRELSQAQRESFSEGIGVLTAPSARALADRYEFCRHDRVLDLGGGDGSFLAAILSRHPRLQATLFEIPDTAAIARRKLAALQVAVHVVEGDLHCSDIPTGFDAVVLANVVHLFGPARNQALFARVRAAVPEGARLLLVDFWTNAGHTEPGFAALIAAEFQIVTGEGDVYSVEEIQAWLQATGWRFMEHVPLQGAASLIVAEAA